MMQSHSAKCQFGQKGRRFLNVFADNRLIVHDVQRCLEHNAIRGCAIWRIVAAPKRFQRVKVNFSSLFWCKRRRHTCSEIEASIEGSGVNVIKLISFCRRQSRQMRKCLFLRSLFIKV